MMGDTIEETIDRAKRSLDEVNARIAATPNLNDLEELIAACKDIDLSYVDYCGENDTNYGYEDGETYRDEDGPCSEFYIESSWWHRVSLALRKVANSSPSGDKT